MAQKFTGKVEMQKDGTVKMYTVPTVTGAEDYIKSSIAWEEQTGA